jgi:hypothetical protein
MIRNGHEWRMRAYAFAFLTPDNPRPSAGAIFECRAGAGSAAQSSGYAAGVAAPAWLKLSARRQCLHRVSFRRRRGVGAVRQRHDRNERDRRGRTRGERERQRGAEHRGFSDVFVGSELIATRFCAQAGSISKTNAAPAMRLRLRGSNLGGWMLHENWVNGNG